MPVFKCTDCSRTFDTFAALARHRTDEHGDSPLEEGEHE